MNKPECVNLPLVNLVAIRLWCERTSIVNGRTARLGRHKGLARHNHKKAKGGQKHVLLSSGVINHYPPNTINDDGIPGGNE